MKQVHPFEDIGISPWPVDVVEFGADAYADRKQVDVKQLYNQVPQTAWISSSSVPVAVGVSWGQDARVRISFQTEGLRLSVIHGWAAQLGRERSAAMVRRTLDHYVAVCLRLQLTSHTQPTSTLSNKVWEVYFHKEVCSFVHWSFSLLLIMFPLIFIYVLCICMWLYNRDWTCNLPMISLRRACI